MRRRALALLMATVAMTALVAGPAAADPQNMNTFGPIAVDCDAAGVFDVVAHGSSDWSAVQVLDSTAVLVPLKFQNQEFTYTDPDGNPFPDSVADLIVKGSGKQQGVWCDYSFDIDTGNGLENLSGAGEVYLKITPAK